MFHGSDFDEAGGTSARSLEPGVSGLRLGLAAPAASSTAPISALVYCVMDYLRGAVRRKPQVAASARSWDRQVVAGNRRHK